MLADWLLIVFVFVVLYVFWRALMRVLDFIAAWNEREAG